MGVRNVKRNLNRPFTNKELRLMERGTPIKYLSFKNKTKSDRRHCLWCQQSFEPYYEYLLLTGKVNRRIEEEVIKILHGDVLPMLEEHVQNTHVGGKECSVPNVSDPYSERNDGQSVESVSIS